MVLSFRWNDFDEIKDLLINHLFQSLYQVRMEKMTISLPLISISKLQRMEITEQLIQSGAKEFALVSGDYSKKLKKMYLMVLKK